MIQLTPKYCMACALDRGLEISRQTIVSQSMGLVADHVMTGISVHRRTHLQRYMGRANQRDE